MASVPEALYVQSVSGLHSGTNPISGDFSVGAEGLMVRGGEFAEPVREVTIASTLQRMLLDIADIGADLTFLPGVGRRHDGAVERDDAQRRAVNALDVRATPRRSRIASSWRIASHGFSPEVHGFHAVRARGGDVVGVVVDEHGLGRARCPCVRT